MGFAPLNPSCTLGARFAGFHVLRPAFFLLFPADFLFFPADRLQIGFEIFSGLDSVLKWPTRALRPTAAASRPKAQRREGDGSHWVCSAVLRESERRLNLIRYRKLGSY
jgi:hypothetical protein